MLLSQLQELMLLLLERVRINYKTELVIGKLHSEKLTGTLKQNCKIQQLKNKINLS